MFNWNNKTPIMQERWYGARGEVVQGRGGMVYSCNCLTCKQAVVYKHALLHHPNKRPQFEFRTEKFFSDAISAQIYEGVCINNSKSDEGYLLNSRAEYEQGNIARVVVLRGLNE